jgi:hypothetical protein
MTSSTLICQSLQDRSPNFCLTRQSGRLFDFQEAAAKFCLSQLQKDGGACVLALDTGCGKTCTAREVILQLHLFPVVYIAPGGLCRQLRDALLRPPWAQDSRQLRVSVAETGKQLSDAKELRPRMWDVLVVNRALQCPMAIESLKPPLVVVDEAHQCSQSYLRFLRTLSARTLFLTATPLEATNLHRFFAGHSRRLSEARRFSDTCFYFRKTERVMLRLGTAKTLLEASWKDLERPDSYYADLLRLIRTMHVYSTNPLARLMCALVVCQHARAHNVNLDACPLLGPILDSAVSQAGCVYLEYRSFFHQRTASHLFVDRLVPLRLKAALGSTHDNLGAHCSDLSRNVLLEAASLLPFDADPDQCQPGELPGFWLLPQEYDRLFQLHLSAAPRVPLWTDDARHKTHFSSAIVRLENREAVEATASELARDRPDMQLFVLHTGLTAARRAVAINKFRSHGGERAKILFFIRGIMTSPGNESVKTALSFGGGHMSRELYSYLSRPRLLLADDTVDVGFDLHRHVDTVLLPRIVPDRTTLLQIVGRVSRIATDVHDQGSIKVSANLTTQSLDSYFERRLHRDVVPLPKPERRTLERLTDDMRNTIVEQLQDPLTKAWFDHVVSLARRARLA